ncbi:Golgi to ER traffic protein 4 homolog [Ischnura elegans]|uniref:Golgi to ER traffic protein 4 homolog n=1 Tax=Ischnura elegans TaxID=197161 RepID=UPI001ED88991|nr:Golgi to ER traffic protein 4 homolog [Ischnura elegans]
MAAGRLQGVQRVLGKLQASVNAGNYYEAHQMYRTLYFRYCAQKKYDELLELLYDGAMLFFRHDQLASGADVSLLYVDVLSKAEKQPSEVYINKLCGLFAMMKPDEVAERDVFLASALRWSASCRSSGNQHFKTGHPLLHRSIAQIYWQEKNYSMARYHFLHSTDGPGCAKMLVELHTQQGYASEIDLFIAQAVLQYLCLRNKSTANEAFKSYTSQHPNIKRGPPYLLPLLNFIWFLLQAVESGKLAVFKVLCEEYQLSIKRDPSYRDYLDKIGQIFFGAVPPQKPQGLFSNFLGSIMSAMENSDSEEDRGPSTSGSQKRMETDELD